MKEAAQRKNGNLLLHQGCTWPRLVSRDGEAGLEGEGIGGDGAPLNLLGPMIRQRASVCVALRALAIRGPRQLEIPQSNVSIKRELSFTLSHRHTVKCAL